MLNAEKALKPNSKASTAGKSVAPKGKAVHGNDAGKEWIGKQSKCFQDWLNYKFSIHHVIDLDHEHDQQASQNGVTNSTKIETTDETLKTLMERQDELKRLLMGQELVMDDAFSTAMNAVMKEVDEGRLAIKEDRNIQSDLGWHESLLELFFAYDFIWLQYGLQVIFNHHESIVSKHLINAYYRQNGTKTQMLKDEQKIKHTFKQFILHNILLQSELVGDVSNSVLLSGAIPMDANTTFSTLSQVQSVKHNLLYGAQSKKRKEVVQKYVIQKILAFVLFLDVARRESLILRGNLFRKSIVTSPNAVQGNSSQSSSITNSRSSTNSNDSGEPWRSSKDILLAFSRCFLKSEGNVLKHLQGVGYEVSFEQKYIDEFDYHVKDVLVDLRDGVRLAKLVDITIGSDESDDRTSLSEQLRVPAISRLQKIHNVTIVMQALASHATFLLDGCTTKDKFLNDVKHIVDGDRDATLLLLWKIMYAFELQLSVDAATVLSEIDMIQRDKRWKSLFQQGKLEDSVLNLNSSEEYSIEQALQLWCQVIVTPFDMKVHDLSVSFCDSKLLCLLVYYYHPALFMSTFLKKKFVGSSDSPECPYSTVLSKGELQSLLLNETKNFHLFKSICKSIGGIPMILHDIHSGHPPDERTLVIFLGYFFSRMVESSRQIRAAILIQGFYRSKIENVRCKKLHRSRTTTSKSTQNDATKATKGSFPKHSIHFVHKHNRDSCDSIVAKSESLSVEAEAEAERLRLEAEAEAKAAAEAERLRLQAEAAAEAERLRLEAEAAAEAERLRLEAEAEAERLRLEAAAEAERLRLEAEAEAERLRLEAEAAAEAERLRLEAEAEAERLRLEAEAAAEAERLRLEAEAEAQRLCLEAEAAARETERLRLEAEAEAEKIRSAQQRYERLVNNAATKIQSIFRMSICYHTRRMILFGVTHLQANFRSFVKRKSYLRIKLAVEIIQHLWRRQKALRLYCSMVNAALSISSSWRRYQAARSFRNVKFLVLSIQKLYRMHLLRSSYLIKKNKARVVQKWWRSSLIRHRIIHKRWLQKTQIDHLKSKAMKTIQNFFWKIVKSKREQKARKTIFRFWKSKIGVIRIHNMLSGFTKLAAVFRGRHIRKYKTSKQITAIARSLLLLKQKALENPHLLLSAQVTSAIDLLQHGKMVSQYIKSCQKLQFATQLSYNSCEIFVRARCTAILFTLVQSCNRSTPHQELLR